MALYFHSFHILEVPTQKDCTFSVQLRRKYLILMCIAASPFMCKQNELTEQVFHKHKIFFEDNNHASTRELVWQLLLHSQYKPHPHPHPKFQHLFDYLFRYNVGKGWLHIVTAVYNLAMLPRTRKYLFLYHALLFMQWICDSNDTIWLLL